MMLNYTQRVLDIHSARIRNIIIISSIFSLLSGLASSQDVSVKRFDRSQLGMHVSVTSTDIIIKEPLLIETRYQNNSDIPLAYLSFMQLDKINPNDIDGIRVKHKGTDERIFIFYSGYYFDESIRAHSYDSPPEVIPTASPHSTLKMSRWHCVGVWIATPSPDLAKYEQEAFEFMFSEAGKYSINRYSADSEPITINVLEPQGKADIAASKLWTKPLAAMFQVDVDKANDTYSLEDWKNGVKILEKYPDSRFAMYAAVALLKRAYRVDKWKQPDYFRVAENYLSTLTKEKVNHPAFPEAATMLIKKYNWQKSGRNKAIDYVQMIAEKNPMHPVLSEIQKESHIKPGTPKQPSPYKVPKSTDPARISFENLERIPEGPREVFKRDFQNFAEGKTDSAVTFLSGEYLGDNGPAPERKTHYERLHKKFNIEAIEIVIINAPTSQSYTHPLVIQAPERKFEGDLCLIHYSITLESINRNSSERERAGAPENTTALRKESDEWKIISEHTVDPTGRREEAMKKLGLLPDTDQTPVPAEQPAPAVP